MVLAVGGELDLATAPRLHQAVTAEVAAGRNRLVLDLSGADFIDSVGLGMIVGSLRRARSHGGDLLLVCPEPRLVRVFQMCDLDRVFDLYADVDSAVGAVRPA